MGRISFDGRRLRRCRGSRGDDEGAPPTSPSLGAPPPDPGSSPATHREAPTSSTAQRTTGRTRIRSAGSGRREDYLLLLPRRPAQGAPKPPTAEPPDPAPGQQTARTSRLLKKSKVGQLSSSVGQFRIWRGGRNRPKFARRPFFQHPASWTRGGRTRGRGPAPRRCRGWCRSDLSSSSSAGGGCGRPRGRAS